MRKILMHRVAITLICCVLLMSIMQSVSWLVHYNMQKSHASQLEAFTRSQAQQLSHLLSKQIQIDNPDITHINQTLTLLSKNSHILDASLYSNTGELITHAGEKVPIRDRLALDHRSALSLFTRQIVQTLTTPNGPVGFLRLTLDIRPTAQDEHLPDYLINLLRISMIISLIIGIVMTRTLSRQSKNTA